MAELFTPQKAKYPSLELNNVAFRRDGRIEAQCKPTGSLVETDIVNGMLLAIDNVTRTVDFADATDDTQIIGLNYSTEHLYDERTPGLGDYRLNNEYSEFYPRLGLLARGDKFTTDCLCYETTLATDDASFIAALDSFATTPLYGGISDCGRILVDTAAPTVGPVLKVVASTTVPNGGKAAKFQVIKG